MSEWSTYSLSDFLLFSPRTYYRLFELYNAEIWPAHLLALAGGLGVAGLLALRKAGAWRDRAAAALLAAAWLWVGWAYMIERFATINWAADYFAWAFAAEALLLVGAAFAPGRPLFPRPPRSALLAGFALIGLALLLQPLVGPALGRPWVQAEVFGIAPDPTVAATLGALLLAQGWRRWVLLPIPLAWCAVSGATLWAMQAPDALLLPVLGALALVVAAARSLAPRRGAERGAEPQPASPFLRASSRRATSR